jgi:hypothetical protein
MLCLCRRGVANRFPRAPGPALVAWAQASCNSRPCKPASEGRAPSALLQAGGKDGEGTRKSFFSRAAQSSRPQSVTQHSHAILRRRRSYANLSQSYERKYARSKNQSRPMNGCWQNGSIRRWPNRRKSWSERNSPKNRPTNYATLRRTTRPTSHHRLPRNVVRKQRKRIRRPPQPPQRWRAA